MTVNGFVLKAGVSIDDAKEEIMASVEMYKDAPVKPAF